MSTDDADADAGRTDYAIHTDIAFSPLERIDVAQVAAACREKWFNQTLCRVNDCVIRLGILCGEFHWHKHDREDEFFYVIEGRLLLDLDPQGAAEAASPGRTVSLGAGVGFSVPRGVVHRTRAPERTVVMMIEGAGVVPTGDA